MVIEFGYELPSTACDQVFAIFLLLLIALWIWQWNANSLGLNMRAEKTKDIQPLADLLYDVRVVRSTRFGFSKRMEIKSKAKAFTVNVLSVAALFISVYLLANASGIGELTLKGISISIIGLSLLALWMSLDTPSSELSRKSLDATNVLWKLVKCIGQQIWGD